MDEQQEPVFINPYANWNKVDTCKKREIKRYLGTRDGLVCHYCNRRLEVEYRDGDCWFEENDGYFYKRVKDNLDYQLAVVDHKIPTSEGGTHITSNLVLCCHSCNSRKGSKPYLDFLQQIELEENAA